MYEFDKDDYLEQLNDSYKKMQSVCDPDQYEYRKSQLLLDLAQYILARDYHQKKIMDENGMD